MWSYHDETQLQYVVSEGLFAMKIDHYMGLKLFLVQTKWQYFADDIFKCIFFYENVWIFIKISLKFAPKGPVYIVNIGLGNGLVSNRHQAITWTNDDPFQLCIYASPTVFETQSKKLYFLMARISND